MAIYFFNVTDNGMVSPDFSGRDLPDDGTARRDALEMLGERARDELPDGDHRMFVIDVMDEARKPVLTANLSLMVTYPRRLRSQPG